mmetsp:Transcript_21474/g.59682  ORF Transcript_21474/g.59682 Transcript_21474/m.59682 type:complete len:1472 (-) Transcript_21474:6226-10641(-)
MFAIKTFSSLLPSQSYSFDYSLPEIGDFPDGNVSVDEAKMEDNSNTMPMVGAVGSGGDADAGKKSSSNCSGQANEHDDLSVSGSESETTKTASTQYLSDSSDTNNNSDSVLSLLSLSDTAPIMSFSTDRNNTRSNDTLRESALLSDEEQHAMTREAIECEDLDLLVDDDKESEMISKGAKEGKMESYEKAPTTTTAATASTDSTQETETESGNAFENERDVCTLVEETIPPSVEAKREQNFDVVKEETRLVDDTDTEHETETETERRRSTEEFAVAGAHEEGQAQIEAKDQVNLENEAIFARRKSKVESDFQIETVVERKEEGDATIAGENDERDSEAKMEAKDKTKAQREGDASGAETKEEELVSTKEKLTEEDRKEQVEVEKRITTGKHMVGGDTKATLETNVEEEEEANTTSVETETEETIQMDSMKDMEKEDDVAAVKTEENARKKMEVESKRNKDEEAAVATVTSEAEAKEGDIVTTRARIEPRTTLEDENIVEEEEYIVEERAFHSTTEGVKQFEEQEPLPRVQMPNIKATSEGGNMEELSVEKETGTNKLSLARRMKQMFDSASPDEPSRAFGKNVKLRQSSVHNICKKHDEQSKCDVSDTAANGGGSPTSSSLAKDMKKMFDSPTPEEPSMAFGLHSRNVGRTLKLANSDTKQDRRHETKLFGNQNESRPSDRKEEDTSSSPASQMASLLLVSSVSKKKMNALQVNKNTRESAQAAGCRSSSQTSAVDGNEIRKNEEEQSVNRGTIVNSQRNKDRKEQTVACDTVRLVEMKHKGGQDIKEIAFHDCSESVIRRDEDEFIEEIIIEDDHEDVFSVTTDGEFFERTACFEVSTDFLTGTDTEDNDVVSYDEITADDWEFEETTVDDNDILYKKEEGGDITNENDNFDHTKIVHPLPVNLASSGRRKDVEEPLKVHSEACHAANASEQTTQKPIKKIDSKIGLRQIDHQISTIDLEEENSTRGRFADKIKMFDMPKAAANQNRPALSRQPCVSSKPLVESGRSTTGIKEGGQREEKRIEKVSIDPKRKPIHRPYRKEDSTPKCVENDDALVDEIILLVKEPGAMMNRQLLAERITALLIGEDTEEPKAGATKASTHSAPSNILNEQISSKSHNEAEANAYSSRKEGGFKDTGLKQMRKDVLHQKGKLRHIDDPDTITARNMKRISSGIIKLKEHQPKPSSVQQVSSVENQTTLESSACAEDRDALAERMIAKIWSNGGKSEPKPWSRSSKSMSSENRKNPSPSKLGDRLKMFESPSSSPSPMQEDLCNKTIHSRQGGPKRRVDGVSKVLSVENMQSSEIVSGRADNNQVSRKTLKSLGSFQRLWRTMKSKPKRATAAKAAGSPKKNVSFSVSPCDKKHRDIETHHSTKTTTSKITTIYSSENGKTSNHEKQKRTKSFTLLGSPGNLYTLEDFEQGRVNKTAVDMEKWEEFLVEDEFAKHFGMPKDEFYRQPKWKRDKLRRKIRVSF